MAEDSIAKDGSGNQLMRIGTDVNNSNNKELYIDDVELFEVEPLQPEEGNLLGLLFDPDNVSNINSGWDGDGWMHWVNTGASPSTSASIDDTVAKDVYKRQAYARANAALSGQLNAYHHAYFDFDLRVSQNNIIGDPESIYSKEVQVYESGKLKNKQLGVRYFFTESASDSASGGYAEMALSLIHI